MTNTLELTNNTKDILTNFCSCMIDFIMIMDQENTCIKEYDTTGLSYLSPLKKECCYRYEVLSEKISELMKQKALSPNDLNKLSNVNNNFIEQSKKNYSYLENSQNYIQQIMDVFFKSLNETTPYSYSNLGQTKFVKSTNPIALSGKF